VKYNIHPRTAIALKALRQRLSDAMAILMKGKSLDEAGSKWFALAIRCLEMLPEVEEVSIGVT
jgi:ATP-dependent RNA helicase DHX29